MEPNEALDLIKQRLSPNRYRHSLGVADTAVILARRYAEDESWAYLAGVLHDYARNLPPDQLLSIAGQHGLIKQQVELEVPDLLHGPVAALLLQNDMAATIPKAVLEAIACHTLGSVQMSELDKILFLADMIEPGRCYPGVGELRKEAFLDLDRAMLLALESSIRYCLDTGKILHPLSVQVRNAFLKQVHGVG
ncbi:MAG: HD domain-containing protein [Syntrophomonadaceae bacterium]|jgi:predicted HD superfamily hydrolase involved in NAD metabolism|nr:HD domain-containing protein [Syntrophomonadaceae bacterium]